MQNKNVEASCHLIAKTSSPRIQMWRWQLRLLGFLLIVGATSLVTMEGRRRRKFKKRVKKRQDFDDYRPLHDAEKMLLSCEKANVDPCQDCSDIATEKVSSVQLIQSTTNTSSSDTCYPGQSDRMDAEVIVENIINDLIGLAVQSGSIKAAVQAAEDHMDREKEQKIEKEFEENFEPVQDHFFVHRAYQPDEPIDSVRDDANERLEDLEHEVASLQECLEVAEAHVDKVEAELLKEKAKVELIEKELEAKDRLSQLALTEKDKQLQESVTRAEKAEKLAYENHLNHQDQLEMFAAQLKEKESEIREKEESNHMLRREMLEIMNKFNNEKADFEARIDNYKGQIKMVVSDSEVQRELKQKRTESKVLQKEVIRLRHELETQLRTSDRAKKIALILDAIDSID